MRPREHYQHVPVNTSENLEHLASLLENSNYEENGNILVTDEQVYQFMRHNDNLDEEDKDEEDMDIPEVEEDEMEDMDGIEEEEEEEEFDFIEDDIFYENPSLIDFNEEEDTFRSQIMNNRNPYGDAIFHNSAPNRNSLRYPNDYQIGSSSRSRNQDNNSDKSNLESLFWEAAEFILNYAPTHDISFKTHQLSFLQPGRTFTGSQNLILDNNNPADRDKWEVKVAIHSINPEQGTIVGLMEALNVPSAATTVITYWEGEIIDFINFTMRTKKWSADSEVDLFHWKMFQPFKHFDPSEENIQNIYENYIFMRWKEKFFVNVSPTESGLTIAGFYYICIRRIDGHIEGLYFEPGLTPFQKLSLQPTLQGSGLNFSEYAFA